MEKCARCGEILPFQMGNEENVTCQSCGATDFIVVDDIKEKMVFKAKPHGKTGKHELEITMCDDFFRKENTWTKLKRVIDRGHDHYEEQIVDPKSKKTIRFCKEPLSSHIGHGSDNKGPKK